MKILITGNMGYVGPLVTRHLRRTLPDCTIVGFDNGYFAHCLTTRGPLPDLDVDLQYFGDVRAFPPDYLQGVDAVIHLAAISNDPMGNQFEAVTRSINYEMSVDIARKAKAAGVRSFVFASSCSIYGSASDAPRTEDAPTNPLTAYAKSKIATEAGLRELADGRFRVTCLRFATACGWSPRVRLDLVLNDFVASAVATGRITVLSDGTPWRPLIHVADMARAMEWAANRTSGDDLIIINTGSDAWNYQVRALAQAVALQVPGTEVSIDPNAPPDKRSYRVDFSAFARLAPSHQPQVDLPGAVRDLLDGFRSLGFADAGFRNSSLIRLNVLKEFRSRGLVDAELRWQEQTNSSERPLA